MDNNEKIRDRIRQSLENASSTIELKLKIENEIISIMNIIHELTNGEIGFTVKENKPAHSRFVDCEKLVFLKKTSVNHPYGFTLIGYSLNNETGYPVSVETESEYYDCNNEMELKDIIASIIEKKSLQIIQLMSEKVEDIPF